MSVASYGAVQPVVQVQSASGAKPTGFKYVVRFGVRLSAGGRLSPKEASMGSGGNVYAMFAHEQVAPLTVPAAYQHPLGKTFGGINPSIYSGNKPAILKLLRFDSWLAIGTTDGATSPSISHMEVSKSANGFSAWGKSSTTALKVVDGLVFMKPDQGCNSTSMCVLGQLTLASTTWGASVNLHGTVQGKSNDKWEQLSVKFSQGTLPSNGASKSFLMTKKESVCRCKPGSKCTKGCAYPYLNHTCG